MKEEDEERWGGITKLTKIGKKQSEGQRDNQEKTEETKIDTVGSHRNIDIGHHVTVLRSAREKRVKTSAASQQRITWSDLRSTRYHNKGRQALPEKSTSFDAARGSVDVPSEASSNTSPLFHPSTPGPISATSAA